KAELLAHGLDPGEVIADGQFHHFRSPEGRIGDTAAYYKLSDRYGIYGDFRTGLKGRWLNGISSLSKGEQKALREKVKEEQSRAEAAKREREAAAALEARRQWAATSPIESGEDHSYLIDKQIGPNGIRRLGAATLVVAMFDVATAKDLSS